MNIRILPSNIANMIAAGEVVQRPASAVKELMENAVDAGATQVTVVISDAGKTLIQVIDNGCGMTPDEAVVCFERHATSKITSADDLDNITTFGFRGEALASIAAVAEVTMKTRTEDSEVGCQVDFADSRHLSTIETVCPKGTNISVRNLFYNVPARRKFLKSDNVEFKHIVEEFTRVALTRPEVGFSLIHNDKDVYSLRAVKSLKYRIQDLLGNAAVDKVVDVSADTTIVKVNGYICRPDLATKTLGTQFLFVNGRYFRSPYLHKAIMKAYEGLIQEGVTPSYFLYLEIDPHSIDVNIHPTKTEIKFEDDTAVFQVIYACVKESLGRHSFGAVIDFDKSGVPEMPVFGTKFKEYSHDFVAPNTSFESDFNPFDTGRSSADNQPFINPFETGKGTGESQFPEIPVEKDSFSSYDYSRHIEKREDYGKLFEDKIQHTASALVLQGKYIVTQAGSGLLVVNVKRALERILFDKFVNSISTNGHISQQTLFPVQIRVGVDNMLIFDEHSELLSKLGFDIASFGNDSIVVSGVPEGYSLEQNKVEALMADVLLVLNEDSSSLSGMFETTMSERLASIGAENSKPVTSNIEAQRIIDSLFSSTNAEYTSRGKKIMTILPLEEIEKKF